MPTKIKLYIDEPIIPPPETMIVTGSGQKVVLYLADGTPLTRKVGF